MFFYDRHRTQRFTSKLRELTVLLYAGDCRELTAFYGTLDRPSSILTEAKTTSTRGQSRHLPYTSLVMYISSRVLSYTLLQVEIVCSSSSRSMCGVGMGL